MIELAVREAKQRLLGLPDSEAMIAALADVLGNMAARVDEHAPAVRLEAVLDRVRAGYLQQGLATSALAFGRGGIADFRRALQGEEP